MPVSLCVDGENAFRLTVSHHSNLMDLLGKYMEGLQIPKEERLAFIQAYEETPESKEAFREFSVASVQNLKLPLAPASPPTFVPKTQAKAPAEESTLSWPSRPQQHTIYIASSGETLAYSLHKIGGQLQQLGEPVLLILPDAKELLIRPNDSNQRILRTYCSIQGMDEGAARQFAVAYYTSPEGKAAARLFGEDAKAVHDILHSARVNLNKVRNPNHLGRVDVQPRKGRNE